MDRRPGLRRVEVLVGVLIAALVVGLFAAGGSQMRSSANQMTCRNNLKQLGLAVTNYHDTNGELPPVADQGKGAFTGQGLPSVLAMLTPYIEADWSNYDSRRVPREY